jgi:ABC-2 type transport system permease protein
MTRAFRHVFWLGWKELLTLSRTPALIAFILYALTVLVYATGEGISLEVQSATVAVVDEDGSQVARSIVGALRPPRFRTAQAIPAADVGAVLDSGTHTFVLQIPPGFERDLLQGRKPRLKLDVDATAVSHAYLGASYLEAIVAQEALRRRGPAAGSTSPPAKAQVRVRFNPNRRNEWQVGVMFLAFMITLLSAVLPAAALLREREHGTIEQMLSMPLHPVELILGKAWAYVLVILAVSWLSLVVVVEGALGTPVHGSYALLLVATLVYLFTTAGLGMLLATIAGSLAQVGLLSLLVLCPMMYLSGVWMPVESMPESIRWIAHLMPLHYYAGACYGVIFRGAGLDVVGPDLALLGAMGATAVFAGALRFRSRFGVPAG